jgi:lactate dehydrogenase-like 2-hydroxyacid dehydrogenase
MEKPRVFITRLIPDEGLSLIREACEAEVWPGELPPPHAALVEKVRGADGLLCLLTDPVDAEVIAAGARLKVISTYAVGYDNIDIAAATARGIPVGNTPGILTETTADFTFALLLAAARRVAEGDRTVRAGQWKTWGPTTLLGVDVHHAVLGVIGFGRIGRAVARRARGFDMTVLYYDPAAAVPESEREGARPVDLETLLRESDFISIHTPLNEATRRLIRSETLAMMKPTAVLVNTARGGVVDTQDLYEALRGGVIAYAALDVTDPEPIPADHPLLSLDNVLIAPHIASASRATRGTMALYAARNLIAGLRGESLPFCVNPQVYER